MEKQLRVLLHESLANFTAGWNNAVQNECPSNTLNKQPARLLVALSYISLSLSAIQPAHIKALKLHPAHFLRCNHALQLITYKGEALPGQHSLCLFLPWGW